MVTLVGIAAATSSGVRRVVGVEAHGINACPSAQGLVRGQAAERLAEAGFENIERILEPVPLATHNQRGSGRCSSAPTTSSTPTTSMRSSRLDERTGLRAAEAARRALVVEHAHLQPRFVEDSVSRFSLKGALDPLLELDEDDFLFARQVNFETIHTPRCPRRA